MKKTKHRIAIDIFRAMCIMLAVIMTVCPVPAFAEETASEAATDISEESEKGTVQVVFAAKDILQGDRINNESLKIVEIPDLNLPENTVSTLEDAVGKIARKNIYADEYIYSGVLSKENVARVNPDALVKPVGEVNGDFVIVTDYVRANTGLEVDYYVQQLIDLNPHRTIYFPAGEYIFGSPITTAADARYSVSLLLDDGAVIKASDSWRAKGELDALICLGGNNFKNDIATPGSYYLLQGGVLDGNDKTSGVAIEGGRETVVRNLCIRNAKIGLNVRKATNNTSSDCDFEDITIIGSNKPGSIGINNLAADNNFTTIRIYDVQIGITGTSGGHIQDVFIVNNHPEKLYSGTVGITSTCSFISGCYVENFETAYQDPRSELIECTAAWTSDLCKRQVFFNRTKKGTDPLSGCRAIFRAVEGAEIIFAKGNLVEHKSTMDVAFDESLVTNDSYKKLTGDNKIVWIK